MSDTAANQSTPDHDVYHAPPSPPEREYRPWSAGRVIAFVIGAFGALMAVSLLVIGLVGLIIDQTQRDSDGLLETEQTELVSNGYAVAASGLEVDTSVPGWLQLRSVFGDIRIVAEGTAGEPIFIGLAHEQDAADYLDTVGYDEVSRISGGNATYRPHPGTAPVSAPSEQDFWAAWTEGSGEQTLTVELDTGNWVAVVMNADGSAGVDVTASAAAELPVLPWAAIVLMVIGGAGLVIAVLVIYLAVRERRPQPTG